MAEVEHAEEIKRFKDNMTNNAEHLIFNVIPNKIIELNSLLETPQFSSLDLSNVHRSLNVMMHVSNPSDVEARKVGEKSTIQSICPVYKRPVPINEAISDLIEIVKPYIRELIKYAKEIKMWIALLIPKIQDGNNFGVEVQENALYEIITVEITSLRNLEQIPQYFLNRAKTISKLSQFPFIEDYQKAIQESDECTFFKLRRILINIRNSYCTLHDIVTKNLEKIKKPRSTDFKFEDLY